MPANIYEAVLAGTQLRQGEILTGVTQHIFDQAHEELEVLQYEFCIVASQECDLARDWEAEAAGEANLLNGVLMFVAQSAIEVRASIGGRDIWKRIIQNSDERYQALEAAAAEFDLVSEGLPPLIVDFRRYFTVSPKTLYWQIAEGHTQRRTRLCSPYREHLQSRAAGFLSRVGLDRDHDVPMNPAQDAAAAPVEGPAGGNQP